MTETPWHTEPYGEHGRLVRIKGADGREVGLVTAEDAPVVTAAPELLAACEMVELASYRPLVEGELLLLRAAIAKARGEEATE